jgi:ribosomal protein L40E
MDSAATQLGKEAFALHVSGKLHQVELAGVLAHMSELSAQIAAVEAELRAIQAETFAYETPGPRCARCGATNDTAARFCHQCGTLLPPEQTAPPGQPASVPAGAGNAAPGWCITCGATNPPAMRFCQNCGSPLDTPVAAAVTTAQAPQPGDGDHAATPPTNQAEPAEPAIEVVEPAPVGDQQHANIAEDALPTIPASEQPASTPSDGDTEAPARDPAEERRCPACGAAVLAGASFCAYCGHAAASS